MGKRILFVCMGNICRSVAAEGVMQRFAEEAGVDLEVDSAGTHNYHVGELADPRMQAAAEERGYELKSRARHLTRSDLEPGRFDLVLAMDSENYAGMRRLYPEDAPHFGMFSDFLGPEWPRDVPDPYYGGAAGFAKVLDMLEEGCPKILEAITSANARGNGGHL